LKEGTEFFSMSNPPVSSVIPAMDTIDRAFTTAAMDGEEFCLPIKLGLKLGKRIMNKYYNLTDESEIYRVSIGNFCFLCFSIVTNILNIVLHPSLKARYFKANKWPQEWEDEAIEITHRIFDEDYKDFGIVKDRSTSSMNVLQVQNKVSKTKIFISDIPADITV